LKVRRSFCETGESEKGNDTHELLAVKNRKRKNSKKKECRDSDRKKVIKAETQFWGGGGWTSHWEWKKGRAKEWLHVTYREHERNKQTHNCQQLYQVRRDANLI